MNIRSVIQRLAPALVIGAIGAATATAVGGCANPETKARKYSASGDGYAAKQQFKEAVIEYRRALAATPDAADVRYRLGRAYQDSGDLINAYTEYLRTTGKI